MLRARSVHKLPLSHLHTTAGAGAVGPDGDSRCNELPTESTPDDVLHVRLTQGGV